MLFKGTGFRPSGPGDVPEELGIVDADSFEDAKEWFEKQGARRMCLPDCIVEQIRCSKLVRDKKGNLYLKTLAG